MKVKQIRQVMKKYGKAWKNQDTSLILDCFTENGVYQESPLRKPCTTKVKGEGFSSEVILKDAKEEGGGNVK